MQEHTVIESKPEHTWDVIGLNNPWPELIRLVTPRSNCFFSSPYTLIHAMIIIDQLSFFFFFVGSPLLCSRLAHYIFIPHSFAESIDLNAEDPVTHKHIPFVIILVKILEEWTKSHNERFPSTSDEKQAFKVKNCSFCDSLDFQFKL